MKPPKLTHTEYAILGQFCFGWVCAIDAMDRLHSDRVIGNRKPAEFVRSVDQLVTDGLLKERVKSVRRKGEPVDRSILYTATGRGRKECDYSRRFYRLV